MKKITRKQKNIFCFNPFIWNGMFKEKLEIASVSAKTDPFDLSLWWKHGRQVRWVLAEYGAWIFYYWQMITDI